MEQKMPDTYTKRAGLGFPEDYRTWRGLPATFGRHRLTINGHAVMEDWEAEYMQRLAEVAASKADRLLEVGFGMGIAATYIQGFEVEEHVIVEANEAVFGHLRRFADQAEKRVIPILGFWQDVTPRMESESFSSILFDTYPMNAAELHRNHFAFFGEAYRLLKKGGILTYYSDEETTFSPEHLEALREAGFRDIQGEVCSVLPPKGCDYWQSDAILVPIVFK